jgi:multidrug efflux pump subunit AcrA (membrane-fusion protein)
VEEGDTVEKGQILFQVDSSNEYLKVKQAQVAIDSAKLAEASAERDLARNKTLREAGSISTTRRTAASS